MGMPLPPWRSGMKARWWNTKGREARFMISFQAWGSTALAHILTGVSLTEISYIAYRCYIGPKSVLYFF